MRFDRTPRIVVPEGYEPKNTVLTFGGQEVTVYKMSLGSSIRAVRICEPYIKEFANTLFGTPAFQAAAAGEQVNKDLIESEIKAAVIGKLAEMITTVPETVIGLLACLMNFPEEGDAADFFLNVVDLGDLLGAIEELDALNNFAEVVSRLLIAISYLGKRYGIEIPGITVVEKQVEVTEETDILSP